MSSKRHTVLLFMLSQFFLHLNFYYEKRDKYFTGYFANLITIIDEAESICFNHRIFAFPSQWKLLFNWIHYLGKKSEANAVVNEEVKPLSIQDFTLCSDLSLLSCIFCWLESPK
ncbi:hypothetical protein LOAG_05276 [Loa loa]|uniref:Uncharacterized protein n=1 Tax=Loa loa TaxID=7209 RepID=A0A1S0U089_LOALO|nr:hypothetical protein LOAG_05276 [Loa loa]EFO23212.1 hypothetical protein LOAG_05276 [Loa loa]